MLTKQQARESWAERIVSGESNTGISVDVCCIQRKKGENSYRIDDTWGIRSIEFNPKWTKTGDGDHMKLICVTAEWVDERNIEPIK